MSILDESKCDIVTAETVEQLINEIGKIKTQMNNTELQLYEANEKISELIENVSTCTLTMALCVQHINESFAFCFSINT